MFAYATGLGAQRDRYSFGQPCVRGWLVFKQDPQTHAFNAQIWGTLIRLTSSLRNQIMIKLHNHMFWGWLRRRPRCVWTQSETDLFYEARHGLSQLWEYGDWGFSKNYV